MRVLTGDAKSPYGRKAGYQLLGIGGVGKSSVADGLCNASATTVGIRHKITLSI